MEELASLWKKIMKGRRGREGGGEGRGGRGGGGGGGRGGGGEWGGGELGVRISDEFTKLS